MILEKMNLEEVINPQFAFPIVGVILCALLVFAFGFKTPAQPPSFDFEEVQHRKVTSKKKQKGKEKHTKPILNGTATIQARVLPANSNTEAKPKEVASKVSKSKDSNAAERQKSNKSEAKTVAKVKKATNTAARFEEMKEPNSPSDEIVGGGEWVQHISKKERKIRRKEDGVVSETEKLIVADIEKSKGASSPVKKKKKIVEKEPAKKDVIEILQEEPEEVKIPDPAPKPAKPSKATEVKQTSTVSTIQQEPATVFERAPLPEEEHKSSKKVKTFKTSKGKILDEPTEKEVKIADDIDVQDLQTPEKGAAENEISPTSKDSGNVVFDELGDMWQDAKPQKKKKKARRE